MNNFSVPVLFITYCRPDTTIEVFQQIKLLKPNKLYIAQNIPKKDKIREIEKWNQVRDIIESVNWDCEVHRLYRQEHLDVKTSISTAINWFFEHEEMGIILEDDCVPHQSFFWFCKELLERYQNDKRIMMISGTNYLFNNVEMTESYYFSRYYPIWGWATWKRAWLLYDITMSEWPRIKSINYLSSIYCHTNIANFLQNGLDKAYNNLINTWDYQWVYSCIINHGLAICPKYNLISNIGITGTHTKKGNVAGKFHFMPVQSIESSTMVHPKNVMPNTNLDNQCFNEITTVDIFSRGFSIWLGFIQALYKMRFLFPCSLKQKVIRKFNKYYSNPKKYSTIMGRGSIVPVQIEAYFLALNKYVDESTCVLDVGFGLGYGLNILAIKASQVSGVDVDKLVYEYCQDTIVERNPRLVSLELYDGNKLPFEDNSFDVVTCVDVIEHVENYREFINEMLRVSKKGVFLSTPNRRPEYTNRDGTPKNHWHLREWSFEEFDDIITDYGFIEWNFVNGPYNGPFTITSKLTDDTLALSPFIFKAYR